MFRRATNPTPFPSVRPEERVTLKDTARQQSWKIQTELPVEYEIVESHGLFDPENPDLLSLPGGRRSTGTRLVVLDHSVEELYGAEIRGYFSKNRVMVDYLTLPGSEENKSIERVLEVVNKLNDVGTNRLSSPPIVIGGGVVADVVGLAASLYRRGIPFVRVPTTLLGQSMSASPPSPASTTGDTATASRLHPSSEDTDRPWLPRHRSRPATAQRHGRDLQDGLIKDLRLFELLEEYGPELIATRFQDPDSTSTSLPGTVADEVIGRAIAGMAEELQPNLWEKDLQRSVDYGHSFSPLVEMRALPELLHGEAVAMDCVFSALIAAGRG